eukprot:1653137-Pleurochrysis_carterae.AAC.1
MDKEARKGLDATTDLEELFLKFAEDRNLCTCVILVRCALLQPAQYSVLVASPIDVCASMCLSFT